MPVAAIPIYVPKKLLADASPGLRFGMYLKLWGTKFDIRPEDKRSALDETTKLTRSDRRTMQALAERQHALAGLFGKSRALLVLEAVAIAPFTTGLGNEHPLENGFAFFNPYGLPYLPGSGVKGVVRQAARELASGDWDATSGWSLDQSYLLRIGEKEIRLSLLDVLFGRETPNGESGHVRGALSFWDVIPQIDGDQLMVEVMTPHQGHYYQQNGTPHDSGSPNPINFLTVPPKSKFAFYVLCDLEHLRHLAPFLAEGERWKGLVEAAFQHAFQWLGFGAKTSVGYGALALTSSPSDGAGEPRAAAGTTAAQTSKLETSSATIWDRARLQYNAQNGTLIATGPRNATAYAYNERGREAFRHLPEQVQRQIRNNPRSVQVTAHVRGSELLSVEPRK
jgi:CRISPR-associated protein Cmr6